MEAIALSEFKHTTLTIYPETPIGHGLYTPKRVGITLLDQCPGFTGVYLRDENGGLWPARTVNHNPPEHHKRVCDAWLAHLGVHEDKRTVTPE